MPDEVLTITFVTEGYIDLAKNWIRHVESSGYVGEIKIFALDSASERGLPKDLVERVSSSITGLETLWNLRVKIFRSISQSRISFIHSDVDAVWLKNPLNYLSKSNAPFIFSQGTVHPPDVHKTLNFVFCCGFFYYSAIAQPEMTQKYMKMWENRTRLTQDDQTSINQLFLSDIKIPDRTRNMTVDSTVGSFSIYEDVFELNHKDSDLPLVALLPHKHFPRLLFEEDRDDWVVAHPLTPKNSREKIELLKAQNLWI